MEEEISTLAGGQAYYAIPSETWRNWGENAFPAFARDSAADTINGAFPGYYHRWQHGHDLLTDLPGIYLDQGIAAGNHRMGHVVLTDMPSHQGIPIPGFSKNGIGETLVDLGVSHKMLSINLFDIAGGGFLIAEATPDLLIATAGEMPLNAANMMDTFGEGILEVTISTVGFTSGTGAVYPSPLIFIAGLENIAAGCAMIWYDIFGTIGLDEILLGGFVTSAIGGGLGYVLTKDEGKLKNAGICGVKSFIIGSAYTASSATAMGLVGAITAWSIGANLAKRDNKAGDIFAAIDPKDVPEYDLLPKEERYFTANDEIMEGVLPSFVKPLASALSNCDIGPSISGFDDAPDHSLLGDPVKFY